MGTGLAGGRGLGARRAWPALVLGVLVLAVFWQIPLRGEVLSAAGALAAWEPWKTAGLVVEPSDANPLLVDQFGHFHPHEEFISRWVRRGVWPWWNPDLAHGLPLVGNIQNALYYPTNLLLWPWAPRATRGVRVMTRTAVCMLATYAFARALGMTAGGATLAAMIFAFCGFNVVWQGYPHANVAMLLPAILWTLERTLQTGRYGWGAGLALGGGVAVLGGHPPTILHIGSVAAVWLLYRLLLSPAWPAPRLAVGALAWRLGLAVTAAALIASAAVLPWMEYFSQNVGRVVAERSARSLTAPTLVSWVVPDFFGPPTGVLPRGWDARLYGIPGWANYAERTGYVGIAALLLAVLALVAYRPRRALLPWVVVLVLAAVLAYAPPVVGPWALGLPAFSAVNNSRMLAAAGFALAMLAGLGCDTVLHGRLGRAAASILWALTVAALAAGVAVLWPDPTQYAWIEGAGMADAFIRDCAWALVPAAAVGAFVLLAPARAGLALAVLVAVTGVDLWRFASAYNPIIPARLAAPATPGIRHLQAEAKGGRLLPIGAALMPGATMLRYGLADARGADYVNLRHYEFLLTGETGDYNFGERFHAVPDTAHALNLTHAVVPAGVALDGGERPQYDDELRIVRLRGALPRALLVHDAHVAASDRAARQAIVERRVDLGRTVVLAAAPPAHVPGGGAGALPAVEAVTVEEAVPNRVRLRVAARTAGFVVLNDTFARGWRAEVDGEPTAILRANVAFRAVPVAAGRHEVVFRYRPLAAYVGLALMVATLVVLGALPLVGRRRAR